MRVDLRQDGGEGELLQTVELDEQFVVDFVMRADIVTLPSGERFSVECREVLVGAYSRRTEVVLYGEFV